MDPDGDGDPSDGIDGWRLDVAAEVPVKFWREWNSFIRTINPDCYTVAERWDEASGFLVDAGFSATMNYHGFAFPVKGFFADGKLSASQFLEELGLRRDRHSLARRYALQNLIDTHDTERVSSMIVNANQGDYQRPERWGYDMKGGRNREYLIRKPTTEERQRQRLIALFQMVYVGTPFIYYGTETGMWGGDDPSDRMPMVWPDKSYAPQVADPWGRPRVPDVVEFDRHLNKFYRAACRLRRYIPALQAGDVETIAASDESEAFVIRRWDDRHSVYAVFNRGDNPYQWKLKNSSGLPLTEIFTASGWSHRIDIVAEGKIVTVTVPAGEGVVLLQRQQQP
jgi:glycosidase